jgi:hypothetical protein
MPSPALRLVIVSLAVLLACSRTVFPAPQTAPPRSNQQPQATSDVDRLEAIRLCSEQARMVGPRLIEWKKGETKKAGADGSNDQWDFSAHFNSERKRCFVELEWVKSGSIIITALDVYDAFEGQLIGQLTSTKREGETTATIVQCKVFGEEVRETAYRELMRK